MENRSAKKQLPPADMLFWKFTGRRNIFFANGDEAMKHSRIFRTALQRTTPMEQFSLLSRRLLKHLGHGGRVRWNDFTSRFTLDVVGTSVMGFDFEALDNPDGPFVKLYHDVMTAISDPPYIFLPALERWWPRHEVKRKVDTLVNHFWQLLAEKKGKPGNDVITYMFQEPGMSDEEYRDNVIVLFMAGHVSVDSSILQSLIVTLHLRIPRLVLCLR